MPIRYLSGLSVDSTVLVVDAVNDRVGIGTTAPNAKLQIELSGTLSLAAATIVKTTDFAVSSRAGFPGLADNSDGIYFGMGANGTGIPAGFGFFREASGWNTALAFYTNNITAGPDSTAAMQEKMRITSAGNVGIGTTSPISGLATPLTLAHPDGYVGITLLGTGAYAHTWQLYASGDGGSNKFFGIYDRTNGAYRLVTTSSGNVLIGTTTDSGFKLDVSGTGRFTSNLLIKGTTNEQLILDFTVAAGSYTYQSFRLNGANKYRIIGETDNSFKLFSDVASANVLAIASTGAATFSSSVTATSFVKTSGTSSQYLMADGSVSTLTNPVTGTGTTNSIPKWTSASAIGDSVISDTSGVVLIGGSVNVNGENTHIGIDATGGAGRVGFVKKSGLQPFLAFAADPFLLAVSNSTTIAATNTFSTVLSIATSGAATFSSSVTAVGLSSTTSVAGNLNSLIRNTVTAAAANTGYGLAIESEASAATSYALTVRNLAASTTYFHISTATGSVGNVGIGTTAPQVKLSVQGSQNNTITPANSVAKFVGGDAGIFVGTLAGTPNYGSYLQSMRESDALVFPMSLNPLGGNVLIGTTTDTGQKFQVSGVSSFKFGSSTNQQTIVTFDNATNNAYLSVVGIGTTSVIGTWTNGSMVLEAVPFSTGSFILGAYTGSTIIQNGRVNRVEVSSAGALKFNNYGAGTITGTPAFNLAVDSSGNIIETAGGVVDGSGTANFVTKWQDANTVTNSQVFDNGTNVGINNSTPKTKLDVNGTIGFGSKSMSMSDVFANALTVNMNPHNGCYVKITAFGDWSAHSTIAYLGEFFLQNGDGAYGEPGTIIRQVDNTPTDDIQAQIVDPAGSGVRDFIIQLKTTSASDTPFTAFLQFEVRGQYNSVS